MIVLQESIWLMTLGCILFFVILAIFCSTPKTLKSAHGEGSVSQDNQRLSKISPMHLLILGAMIMAIQFGQYTCDKQMKTEPERTVISPLKMMACVLD